MLTVSHYGNCKRVCTRSAFYSIKSLKEAHIHRSASSRVLARTYAYATQQCVWNSQCDAFSLNERRHSETLFQPNIHFPVPAAYSYFLKHANAKKLSTFINSAWIIKILLCVDECWNLLREIKWKGFLPFMFMWSSVVVARFFPLHLSTHSTAISSAFLMKSHNEIEVEKFYCTFS